MFHRKNILSYVLISLFCGVGISYAADDDLHIACADGDIGRTKYLIANGADIYKKNNDGNTPLHLACKSGHVKVAEFLILHGAEINEKDGSSPLQLLDPVHYEKELEALEYYADFAKKLQESI